MKDQQKKLVNAVNGALGSEPVHISVLTDMTLRLGPVVAPALEESELSEVIDYLAKTRVIIIDGNDAMVVNSSHKAWLTERKASIQWKQWDAYRTLLSSKQISPLVVDAMAERNEQLLDLAGDPLEAGPWDRRGLVIGDVQSGKTANYLALFNKAADAGYKVFILLAGTTNKLRQQTQARIDEGFIGIDTRTTKAGPGGKGLTAQKKIGVGLISPDAKVNSQTTFHRDFSATAAGSVVYLDADSAPTVFVIKKNKTVLNNLAKWLETTAGGGSSKINLPMMLLDDEADYASINTNPSSSIEQATAINRGIRDLLNQFERSSYVGFTATPFANVLIDDDPQDDLFPKDFIISLESPSNYFGPKKMFSEEGESNSFVVNIEDAEQLLPIKHLSSHQLSDLPNSLVDSLRVFFLANAIRDLRPAQEYEPRSMLVNVSRFIRVQERVHELLSVKVSEMRDALRYQRSGTSTEWAALRSAFDEHYAGIPESWEEVAARVPEAIDEIRVHLVNSRNNSSNWESVYDGPRPRVIAVGGDVLSRGLTLEGLTTSYFYRKSLAYDTLMQMGRWFGYRDGYVDVCRLWIDHDVAKWYWDIAEAMDELRSDLREMEVQKREPSNFGLAVRCHPASMMTVTARNKARAAKAQSKEINVSDIDDETPILSPKESDIANNWVAVQELMDSLTANHLSPDTRTAGKGKLIWREAQQSVVADFLSSFRPSSADLLFGALADGQSPLARFVASNIFPELAKWDIVLMSGIGQPIETPFGEIAAVARNVRINPTTKLLYVGGSNQRLGGRADLGATLSEEAKRHISELKQSNGGSEPEAWQFRQLLDRPLLLIYPIRPAAKKNTAVSDTWNEYKSAVGQPPLVGIHVAFPRKLNIDGTGPKVTYLVNTVWQKIEELSVVPVDQDQFEEVDEEQ